MRNINIIQSIHANEKYFKHQNESLIGATKNVCVDIFIKNIEKFHVTVIAPCSHPRI